MVNATDYVGDITFTACLSHDGEHPEIRYKTIDRRPIVDQLIQLIEDKPEAFGMERHRGPNRAVVRGPGGLRLVRWGTQWEVDRPTYKKIGRRDSHRLTEALAQWAVWCGWNDHKHEEHAQ